MPTARTDDGVDVAWYELGRAPAESGPGAGDQRPTLLLAHATGFHGHAFAPLADALSDHYRCVALDERGHGDTPPRDDGSFDWNGFARDVLAVVDDAGLDRPFAAGHSAGGAALLLAEIARPGTFRAIYCFEPIVPPVGAERTARALPSRANPMATAARKRRDHFPSKSAALKNYASKPPMSTFHPDALAAYVEHGFEAAPDRSGVRLKCRPESEARTYEMSIAHGAFARLGEIHCPVTIAWGSLTTTFGPDTFRLQTDRLVGGRAEPLEGLGHFGPFEEPGRVARSIRDAFDALTNA